MNTKICTTITQSQKLIEFLDDNLYDICHRYGIGIQARIGNDNIYHVCVITNGRDTKIQQALTEIENIGLKRGEIGEVLGKYLHYYTFNLNEENNPYKE